MVKPLETVWVPSEQGHAKTLVVIIHGFSGSPKKLGPMVEALRQTDALRDVDFLVPQMPFGPLSFHSPYGVLARLVECIDSAVEQGNYKSIRLMGASMGGVFARRVYLALQDHIKDAPHEPALKRGFEKEGVHLGHREWAGTVDRIVMLAAVNRGWTVGHSLGPFRSLLFRVLLKVTGLLALFRLDPILTATRRGSVFITQMRIQWMRLRLQRRESGTSMPLCVQLLGSQDEIVSPEDSVDLISGREFFYLDVENTGHNNITNFEVAGRRVAIVQALSATDDKLRSLTVVPADEVIIPDENVKKVVFVLHGIRDRGYWTHKIARKVRQRYWSDHPKERDAVPRVLVIASETSSYGYFPAFSFIFRSRRHDKTIWLVEEYAATLARYPNATFSFVGHSNGTYLLAHAIATYPAIKFDRAVLAGSVIRRSFDWKEFAPDQIERVVNYKASRDLVLAFLTKPLQRLAWFDIGAAGHDGFDAEGGAVMNAGPVEGGHSAAVSEDMWKDIAEFITDGTIPATKSVDRTELATWVGRLSPVLLAGVVVLAVWVGIMIWNWSFIPETGRGLAVASYAYGIVLALRKL